MCFGTDWRVIVHCLLHDSAKKILCRKYTKNGGGSPVAVAPSSSVDALSLTQRQREMGKTQFHSYAVSAYAALAPSTEAVNLSEGVIHWS